MTESDRPQPRRGYLALVLHAHLPFVRHPEHEDSLEENWLFEAITETYIPLFLMMEDLLADGVDFRLTFSVTPTLAHMLGDPFLQSRYLRKLERQCELAEKEVARTASQAMFGPLARMYRTLFVRVHEAYVQRYDRDLLGAFRRFQELGKVEIIASAATHGYLPLLSVNEAAARTQIRVGAEHYRQTFGRAPRGFWLPECGYIPGLDQLLAEQGIRYTILETHGITRADERPRNGVHAPLYCPSGVAVFGRDPDSSRQVWSSAEGYPGDFDYREFYRDIGYDLDLDYIGPYIHPDGIRIDTGFKYCRITGKGEDKEPYVPEWAERKAEQHAAHFLRERVKQIERLSGMMDREPLVVAPYDAELFGHWWFEGPRWLEYLIRKTALEQDTVQLVTLSEYLERYPVNQTATPSMSSWGDKGFSEVWLNPRNQWIYPHLHQAAEDLQSAVAAGRDSRALQQAGRELLLAQSSDWAFMINSGAMEQYAAARTKGHLLRFRRLLHEPEIDPAWLAEVEAQDPVFAGIDVVRDFGVGKPPVPTLPRTSAPASAGGTRTLHVAMICSELAPFAKTGGLADMVASLSAALEQLGVRISIILPGYRTALESGVHLVRADRYFDREFLYGTPEGDYPDNAERFAFFCRAALELLRDLDPVDVIHAHDWQAALAIAFLKTQPERYPGLASARTVLTVHNLGYQGRFPASDWGLLGLDNALFSPDGLEFHGQINFLKGGLLFADAITTVSRTYADEIRTAEYGFGMEGVFERRARALMGILNGVDYGVWNPATDRFLVRNYDPGDLSGKAECKAELQRTAGLPLKSGRLLVGMVSRLASQKGFDLLEEALGEVLRRDLQLVILGSGDRRYQEFLLAAARRYKRRLAVHIGFDEALAHQIEAGADLFLMPSHYEPGGLNQLYSLKYGTIPLVRSTGGLKDSIQNERNGFTFDAYRADAMLEAIDRALAMFACKDRWAELMQNAMAADHSWGSSAREYLRLYEGLVDAGGDLAST